jgi:conjugative relaxase-like TrwC/TraI family protein
VAGFDLTFTAPKSVSVLWALGSPDVQAAVEAAHQAAVTDVLGVIEARALSTRTGHAGARQLGTRGAVAAGFDHWDSRAHDPNLHTHLVIANRVQGIDGIWRAIDARDLHAGAVAFSELYDAALADHLHHLGISFSWRERGPRRAPAFEADGIPDHLISLFSTRATAIDSAAAELLTAFEAAYGRAPDRVETIRLRQQATLATRPAKTYQPLDALRTEWADRARTAVSRSGGDVGGALDRRPVGLPTDLTDLTGLSVQELAAVVVAGVAVRRSTWTTWNLTAEATRTLKTTRYAGLADRLAAVDALVTAAQESCVALHDPAMTATAATAVGAGRMRWTSSAVLDAEAHLLAATTDRTAPTAPMGRDDPAGLSGDQTAALVAAAGSGGGSRYWSGPPGRARPPSCMPSPRSGNASTAPGQ